MRQQHGLEGQVPVARHLDLRLLSQFLVICQTSKMSAAARKLGLSTPAVSQIVHRLERDVGIVLFERSAQGLRLTPAGSILQERARDIINSEADILQELEAYRTQLLPKLRLYIAESVAKYTTPAIVSELNQIVGQLEVRTGQSFNYVQEFLRGDFEALISSEPLEGISRLDRFNLCEEDLIGLAPAGIPAERRTLHALARDMPFIRSSSGSRKAELIEGYLAGQGLNPPRGIECNSAVPILELVSAGIGWTITTPLTIAYYRPDPARVADLELPGDVPSRQILLLVNSGKLLDVPTSIATSSRASLRMHAATWPAHLASAIRFPDDLSEL